MAKAKSRRAKYDIAARKRSKSSQKNAAGQNEAANGDHEMDSDTGHNQDNANTNNPPIPNPFADLKIDPAKLNVTVPPPEEWDRKTVVTIHKEVTKGKNKKEKAKMKRKLLLKRLQATRQLELDLKDQKRRQQTVITKDLKPLLDSLPPVDMMFHEASEKTTKAQKGAKSSNLHKVKKDRNSMKAKQKHKEMMKDMAIFKQVLNDQHFKENPTETMLNHVTFFVQKEHLELQKAKQAEVEPT